jgi:hypothetical protein
MPTVKKFTITPLKFDDKLVKEVTKRRAGGESVSAIAKALNTSPGRVAMAELVGEAKLIPDVRENLLSDPVKLARGIAKDRRSGKSWGWLAARYGVTEGTCRARVHSRYRPAVHRP